jgi:hypothetical protein
MLCNYGAVVNILLEAQPYFYLRPTAVCKGLQPSRRGSGATEICGGAMCRARYLCKHFPTGLLNDIAEKQKT